MKMILNMKVRSYKLMQLAMYQANFVFEINSCSQLLIDIPDTNNNLCEKAMLTSQHASIYS